MSIPNQDKIKKSGKYVLIPATLEHLAVPLDSLSPYPGNARRGNVADIVASLKRYGQYKPITVNAREIDGVRDVVLAGNHTYRAMCQLKDKGATHIAATTVDVDADTAARINLIDNKLSDESSYELDALISQLQALPDLKGTGYREGDLDTLLKQLDQTQVHDGDYLASNSNGVSPVRCDALIFGAQRIPLTSEEADALTNALTVHVDRVGTCYGFVRGLLHAV